VNTNKMKNKMGVIILLLSLIFSTAGCFSEDADNGSSNGTFSSDYGRIVNTDSSSNNLINGGYVANYGNTVYYPLDGVKTLAFRRSL